jgi:hypothetical protein
VTKPTLAMVTSSSSAPGPRPTPCARIPAQTRRQPPYYRATVTRGHLQQEAGARRASCMLGRSAECPGVTVVPGSALRLGLGVTRRHGLKRSPLPLGPPPALGASEGPRAKCGPGGDGGGGAAARAGVGRGALTPPALAEGARRPGGAGIPVASASGRAPAVAVNFDSESAAAAAGNLNLAPDGAAACQ